MKIDMKRSLVIFLSLLILMQPLAAADIGVVTKNTPLMDEPSIGANKLLQLKHGTKLNVLARNGLWFEVEVINPATPGWVRFSRVRVTESPSTTEPARSNGNALTSLSRSATGLFGYGNRQAQPSGTIATVGIRGLNASDLHSAQPDPRQLQRLNTFRVSPNTAASFAKVAALSARAVDYLEDTGGFSFDLPSGSSSSSQNSQKEN